MGDESTYEKAVRLAASSGIRNLSNYLLYNEEDTPDELWQRLRLNINLCEELGINIYSFPMKYHPIDDPKYFSNRNYIGTHWNRKFIRAVQAVLNSTKGKIGRGREKFQALDEEKRAAAEHIIGGNVFDEDAIQTLDADVADVLSYYMVRRR